MGACTPLADDQQSLEESVLASESTVASTERFARHPILEQTETIVVDLLGSRISMRNSNWVCGSRHTHE